MGVKRVAFPDVCISVAQRQYRCGLTAVLLMVVSSTGTDLRLYPCEAFLVLCLRDNFRSVEDGGWLSAFLR